MAAKIDSGEILLKEFEKWQETTSSDVIFLLEVILNIYRIPRNNLFVWLCPQRVLNYDDCFDKTDKMAFLVKIAQDSRNIRHMVCICKSSLLIFVTLLSQLYIFDYIRYHGVMYFMPTY